MAISTVEEKEIPEGFSVFSLVHNRKPADSTGQVVLSKPGEHPKCRLVRAMAVVLAYNAVPDQWLVEDGDGNDATIVATCGAAIGVDVASTLIEGQVFERNEAICINLTVDGDAANATVMTLQLVSTH